MNLNEEKNCKSKLIIVILVVLIIGIVLLGGYFVIKNQKNTNKAENNEAKDTSEVTTTLGKIKLSCIDDENNPIAGCEFELLDNEEKSYGKIKSGDDGIITFYKVPEGDYKIKQIETNPEYELKEEDTKNVTVKGGETSEVTFENKVILGKFEITVVDKNKNAVKGAVFEITDNDDKVVDTISSEENGKCATTVRCGVYYVKEKSVPDGFTIDTKSYAFTVDKDNRTFYKTIEN